MPTRKITDRVGKNPETGSAGFKGMRTSMGGSNDKAFAEWLHNCYVTEPINGSEIVARPGRQPYPASTPNQIGVADNTVRSCKLYTEFAPPGGLPRRLVAIMGGKFYATGLSPGGWQEAVNAATFTAASITLTTGDHYAVMFGGKLIVSTGSYAFQWDGTTNGGITKLTAAGTSLYGRPTVYAAKLFFIAGNRKTILWSEEGDATLGYGTAPYTNNAWDLIQTSTENLTVIKGTNEALVYLRTSSIGAIYGGSAADFKSSSTLDAISATEGTDYPEGSVLVGDTLWFLNNQGRPYYFHLGSTEIIPVWTEISRAFSPYVADGRGYEFLAAPNAEQAALLAFGIGGQAEYIRSLDMVVFTYRYFQSGADTTAFDLLIGFNATTKTCQTVWSFPTPFSRIVEHFDTYLGTVSFGLGMVDQYGYAYTINPSALGSTAPRSQTWFTDKDFRNVDQDVTASVIGPRHFEAQGTELRAERLDVEYLGGIAGAQMQLRFATPYIMQAKGVRFDAAQPINLTLEGNASVPGQGVAPLNAQMSVGLNELGRWIAFGFSWGHQASQARLVGWTVTASADSQHPRMP